MSIQGYKAHHRLIVLLLGLAIFGSVSGSSHLLDPRLRDESIAGTRLEVEYFIRPDGLYEYVYSMSSPVENKGTIVDMFLDLKCDTNFGLETLPYADGMPGYYGIDRTHTAAHTPTAIHANPGSAAG